MVRERERGGEREREGERDERERGTREKERERGKGEGGQREISPRGEDGERWSQRLSHHAACSRPTPPPDQRSLVLLRGTGGRGGATVS